MEQIRKYPIGVQDFAKLREGNNLYVDKTEYLWRLVNTDAPYFFGRPRRFGKSLLLSTLKYYFQGRKDLFKGLAIEQLEKDWTVHPVFHIDFNLEAYLNYSSLETALDTNLRNLEETWGRDADDPTPASRLASLMRRTCEKTGRRVVVLVDEYDKPLLSMMDNLEEQEKMRTVLKGFYGVLKSCDQYLRFAFLTGVTRFSKVSIFSDLNQLSDISMSNVYAGMCGISETELLQCFKPDIEMLATATGKTYDETLARLKKMYDGYHFCEDAKEGMYNPYSVLNTFSAQKFYSYWYETGTPTFLVKRLQQSRYNLPALEGDVVVTRQAMMDYRTENPDPIPVLYQSGYLTIKGYDPDMNMYTLGFPNDEVKYGFINELLQVYAPPKPEGDFYVGYFLKDLREGNVDGFMTRLRAYYAAIPYQLNNKTEKDYQTIFYLLLANMGQFANTEVSSAVGRSDMEVRTKDTIYIFELKLSSAGTAEDALQQINAKNYAAQYAASGKRIVCVGIEFDAEQRTIGRWLMG